MTANASRRSVLRSVLAGSTLLTAGAAAGEFARRSARGGRWHQHGYDAANTGRTPVTGPRRNPVTDWHSELPSADSAALVTASRVLVLSIAGRRSTVHALDRSSGSHRWSVPASDLIVNGVLAVDGDRVFLPGITRPQVAARSLADGEQSWHTDLREAIADPGVRSRLGVAGGFRTAPAVHEGTLYLKLRGGGGIVALAADTGNLDTVFPGPSTQFAVGGDTVCAARGSASLEEYGLTFFDARTGELAGDYTTSGRPGRPTLGSDHAFVGTSENRVHAVGHDGERVWTADTEGWPLSLALAEGVVVARTGESIHAIDAATGELLWRVTSGEARPAIANGVVYVSREKGFDAHDAESGRLRARYRNRDADGTVQFLSIVSSLVVATTPRGSVVAVGDSLSPIA